MRPIQLVRLAALLALAIALAPLAGATLAAQQDYTCYYTFTPRDDPSVELNAKSSCYACSRRGTSGGVYDVKFTKLNFLNETRR